MSMFVCMCCVRASSGGGTSSGFFEWDSLVPSESERLWSYEKLNVTKRIWSKWEIGEKQPIKLKTEKYKFSQESKKSE